MTSASPLPLLYVRSNSYREIGEYVELVGHVRPLVEIVDVPGVRLEHLERPLLFRTHGFYLRWVSTEAQCKGVYPISFLLREIILRHRRLHVTR